MINNEEFGWAISGGILIIPGTFKDTYFNILNIIRIDCNEGLHWDETANKPAFSHRVIPGKFRKWFGAEEYDVYYSQNWNYAYPPNMVIWHGKYKATMTTKSYERAKEIAEALTADIAKAMKELNSCKL